MLVVCCVCSDAVQKRMEMNWKYRRQRTLHFPGCRSEDFTISGRILTSMVSIDCDHVSLVFVA